MLFNLVLSRFYAFFYDLSSLGNFYGFSVDKIVLPLFGRFMHFMHVYFMQSLLISALYKYLLLLLLLLLLLKITVRNMSNVKLIPSSISSSSVVVQL